ncbi:MAG: YfhO family protein [Planctomycetota bacterium]|nr:YfhO family protein [Planctomycetota bacterium]
MGPAKIGLWAVPAFLALGVIVSFHDVAFLGRTFLTTNFVQGASPTGLGSYGFEGEWSGDFPTIDPAGSAFLHEPDARAAHNMVWSGQLPLWNPHLACGQPFLAELPSALLYPLQWILIISDAPWVWDTLIFLRLFLSGIFMFLYLRSMGLERPGSIFGAYGYMLCGFQVWNVNLVFVNSSLLLPLLLYFAERAVRRPGMRTVGPLAATVALQIFAGSPEPSAFAILLAAVYVVYRSATLPDRRQHFWKRVGYAVLASLLGLGLSAPVWIPFVEWLAISFHTHSPDVGLWAMPFKAITQIFAPHSLGPLSARWDGSMAVWDPGYAGTAITLFAILACAGTTGWKSARYFFLGAAIFAALKIYGFPGFNWIVGQLPLFDRATLTRFLSPVLYVSMCALAGASMDAVVRGRRLPLRAASLAMLALVGISIWGLHPEATEKGAVSTMLLGHLAPAFVALMVLALAEGTRRGWISSGALAGALILVLAVDLYLPVPRTRLDRTDPFLEAPYVKFLKDRQREDHFRVLSTKGILMPNSAAAFGLDAVDGNFPIFVGRYMRWMKEVMNMGEAPFNIVSGDAIPDVDIEGADLINLKYVISRPGGRLWPPGGPASVVTPGNVPRGEIVQGLEVGQTFKASRAGLSAVSVYMAVYGREIRGRLEFRLYDGMPGGEPLRVVEDRMERLEDNAHHLFPFDPLPDSLGKSYSFTVACPDATTGNAATIWMHPTGRYAQGSRLEKGVIQEGDLGFDLGYSPSAERYRVVYDEDVTILENLKCFPRAYVVSGAEWVGTEDEAFDRLRTGGLDFRETVILEGGDDHPRLAGADLDNAHPDGGHPGGGPPKRPSVEIVAYEANRVRIAVTMDAPGYLVLLDAYFPGWRAIVDGKPRKIFPANGLFRAVLLEAGVHEIEFRYLPSSLLLGLALAVLSGLIVAAAPLRETVRRLRSRGIGDSGPH